MKKFFKYFVANSIAVAIMGATASTVFGSEPEQPFATWVCLSTQGVRETITLITYTYTQADENSEPVLHSRYEVEANGIIAYIPQGVLIDPHTRERTQLPSIIGAAVPMNSIDFIENITWWPGLETDIRNHPMAQPAAGFIIEDSIENGWWVVRSFVNIDRPSINSRWSVAGFFYEIEEAQRILDVYIGENNSWLWEPETAQGTAMQWYTPPGQFRREIQTSTPARRERAYIITSEQQELQRYRTERIGTRAFRIPDAMLIDGTTMVNMQVLQNLPTVERVGLNAETRTITIHRVIAP